MTKAKRDEEYIAKLRLWLKPGDTVHTILRHRSSSGMSRCISLVFIKDRNTTLDLDYIAARAMGWKQSDKHAGIVASGCGMDMGFHLVYTMSRVIFPEGFGERGVKYKGITQTPFYKRPKTKEEAARMRKDGWAFYGRNGDKSGWDTDGGYALDHKWL